MNPVVIGNATLYLGDCLEILPTLPKVDAVITDPPYGIGYSLNPIVGKGKTKSNHESSTWDAAPVSDLDIVRDKGVVQVIWGGNYYPLPPARGWISWFKPDAPPSLGNFELAWTNLQRTSRQVSHSIAATNGERAGHPTQKPVPVMRFSLKYAGFPGMVLDPYMGSGTTGVACVQLGLQFIGIEIERQYFEIACERIENAQRQSSLLDPYDAVSQSYEQASLL